MRWGAKWLTAQSPFIHEEVLPLARRQGIPVHIISRCNTNGFDHWGMETTGQLLTDTYRAGFDGYNFYETQNLIEMTPEGKPMPKGYSDPALKKAHRELRALQGR